MIKCAVVGMRWGYFHALNIKNKIKGVKLVAVCDKNILQSYLKEKFDVPIYTDFEEMLKKEKLDACILAVPHSLHYPMSIKCLKRKINVYVEKPIACTVEEGKKMIEEAEKNNCILMVGHNRRFNGYTLKLRNLLKNEKIIGGSIFFTGYKSEEYFKMVWKGKEGGGPLMMNFIHDIDDLRFVLDKSVKYVCAFLSNRIRELEVEDTSVGILEMEDGILFNFFVSDTVARTISYSHIFYGFERSYAMPEIVLYKRDKDGKIKEKKLSYKKTNSLLLCEKEFFNSIKEKRKPSPDAYDSLENLKIIEGFKESFKKKKIIEIK